MANPEDIARLQQGGAAWNDWRAQNEERRDGWDLSKANLSGANLRYATICDTVLSGANLEGADLSYTHSIQSSFDRVDLRGAKLCYAVLNLSNFGGTVSKLISETMFHTLTPSMSFGLQHNRPPSRVLRGLLTGK